MHLRMMATHAPCPFIHHFARVIANTVRDRGVPLQCLPAGRFGLGWNAVYHLTDVPSFVSGDQLVAFDPHARYLPGINAAAPGLRIAFTKADLGGAVPGHRRPLPPLWLQPE